MRIPDALRISGPCAFALALGAIVSVDLVAAQNPEKFERVEPPKKSIAPKPMPARPTPDHKNWGAIAVSLRGHAFGWSKDQDSQDFASTHALAGCSRHAGDCAVQASFKDTCAAIASHGRGIVGWAWNKRTVAEAAASAQEQCSRRAGAACEIKAQFCTGAAK